MRPLPPRSITAVSATALILWAGAGAADPPGAIVEEVKPAHAASKAGLRPADLLLSWRLAAPVAGGKPSAGEIRSPFDLRALEVEQAPLGPIELAGRRGEEPLTVIVPPGEWRLSARPLLPKAVLPGYLEGYAKVSAEGAASREEGLTRWRELVKGAQVAGDAGLASWLWSRIAIVELDLGSVEAARASFSRAIAAADRLGDLRRVALLHALLGEEALLERRLELAQDLLRQAVAFYEQQGESGLVLAAALHGLCTATWRRGDLEAAEALCRRTLAIREALAPGSAAAASSLSNLAIVIRRQGDLAAARKLTAIALETAEAVAPEGPTVASSLNSLGGIAWMQGDLEAAETYFRRSLAHWEVLEPGSLQVAGALNNLGLAARGRGDLSAAEGYYRRSLAIHQTLAPGSLVVAMSLNNLGVVAVFRGDLDSAQDYQRQALRIREALAPESLDVATSLNNLATLAAERGDLTSAEDLHARALAIRERQAPRSLDVAVTLNNLGYVAERRGDLATAEDFHRRALMIKEQHAPASLDVAYSLENLGVIASKRGRLDEAEELLRRALALQETAGSDTLDVANVLDNLADVENRRGGLSLARDLYTRSLAIKEELAPRGLRAAQSLHALARVELQLTGPERALALHLRALDALESQAARLGGGHQARGSFLAQYGGFYRDAIDLLVDQDRNAEAFHVLERSRVRGLLALLAERDLIFSHLPEELERERRLANAAYERALNELGDWTRASENADEERQRLLARLEEARRRQEEVQAEVRLASPRLAALESPGPLTLEAAQRALDPGTLLLAYSIGVERSYLFVVGSIPEGFAVLPLNTDLASLRRQVGEFRRLWRPGERGEMGIRRNAAALSEVLLAPASSWIAAAQRLVILPDGPLHYLAFAALRDPGDRDFHYLVEGKPVSVVASATLLKELKSARRSARPPRVAAFADPLYPGVVSDEEAAEPVLRSVVRDGFALSPLPGTRAEAAALDELYGDDARLFLGAAASEEAAKTAAPEASILHFATHGLVDDRRPLSSALALSIPTDWQEGQDNGLLQAWEIFEQVRLDADLVTLSACETALGREAGGEGLLGLTRAFQFAGARTVLASLWAVSDESTAVLMQRFYRYLRGGKSKDDALRLAQLELLSAPISVGYGADRTEKHFEHPFYWAAFQLIGDWK